MDKNKLIKELLQKGQDYSQQLYLLGFFVVFIIMILFVVRPTVNEYVVRNKELAETRDLSSKYQKIISSLTELQALLESNRDDFDLLEDAIPTNIHMYQLTQDVRNSFLRYVPTRSYTFPSYIMDKSNSKNEAKNKTELKSYKILVNVKGTYPNLNEVLRKVLNQRRVKSIKSLMLSKSGAASESADLEMKLEIEAFYL